MKIKVRLTPSTTADKTVILTLDELGCTPQECSEMIEAQRSDAVYLAIDPNDDLFWSVENFEETEK